MTGIIFSGGTWLIDTGNKKLKRTRGKTILVKQNFYSLYELLINQAALRSLLKRLLNIKPSKFHLTTVIPAMADNI
jgi:hypothetical protein